MFKKISVIIILLFTFLTSLPASAQVDASSQIPELNPFCWHRSDCQKIRKQFGGTGTGDEGFITDASVAPCVGGTGDEQWGRCLPAGKSKTEISFGGKSEFSNIGDFIVLMYKYLLTIASIVAVVVIIISGAQWITSGGNSEAIGSAKKRIGGAVIGLFIAYMSYFVLNTINPALVNLRLPQVWLVRPQSLVPEFCSDLPGAKEGKLKFSYVAAATEPNKPVLPAAERIYKIQDNKDFACGNRLLVENGGETTCRGDFCPPEGQNQKTCFDKTGDGKNYTCGDVRISGDISYSSFAKACGLIGKLAESVTDLVSHWGCPPIIDSKLMVVCEKMIIPTGLPVLTRVAKMAPFAFGSGHGESTGHYWVEETSSNVESKANQLCEDYGGVKGFVVEFEMYVPIGPGAVFPGVGAIQGLRGKYSNQYHLVGKGGVDLGWFVEAADEVYKVNERYLFKLEEVLKGARLDVDAANIGDESSLDKKYLE